MSLRREIFRTAVAVLIAGLGFGSNANAQPVFENRTPVGFNAADSTTTSTFVTDKDVTVRVNLNEAANSDFSVIGNFQKLEKSVPFFPSAQAGDAGYMSQAITIDQFGFIHRAWVQQRGTINTDAGAFATPVYGVVYAKSVNGGVFGPDNFFIKQTLRQRMLEGGVAYGGLLNAGQVPAALQAADVCFLSLGSTGFSYAVPGKLYEYIAQARPMVAALPVGAASRLIESEGFGVVADFTSVEDLVAKMVFMLDRNRRRAFYNRVVECREHFAAAPQFLSLATRIQAL